MAAAMVAFATGEGIWSFCELVLAVDVPSPMPVRASRRPRGSRSSTASSSSTAVQPERPQPASVRSAAVEPVPRLATGV
ncbi:MAG TPA: hypothetical protein VGB83_04125 [Actinomycetota bacterium]